MSVVAFQEDRVLFGPKVALETHRRLQAAVAARANPDEAERLFREAQQDDPECLPARFALYKFYFNTVQFEKAEATARAALLEAARQAGFTPDWNQLDFATVSESVLRAGEDPAHFFCFTMKALAFIKLRQGHTAESRAILNKLEELDPEDTVGGSVIRALANRVEEDDE
jgi:tetratricopeptide (TPR) repeat protein